MPTQVPVWYIDNDMAVIQREVRSSTAASTSYINSSTQIKLSLWTGATSSTANLIGIGGATAVVMTYTTGTTSGANGTYRTIVGTSQTTGLSTGGTLITRVAVAHSGLDGIFKRTHKVVRRAST